MAGKVLTEKEFYPFFINDLKNAKKFVVIFSPFIMGNRLETFFPTFRELIQKGIILIIVARSPQNVERPDAQKGYIEELKKMGATVIIPDNINGVAKKFHDKLAFIDKNICYHGSLNILSHWGEASETMIRDTDPSVIQQLFDQHLINFLLKGNNIDIADLDKKVKLPEPKAKNLPVAKPKSSSKAVLALITISILIIIAATIGIYYIYYTPSQSNFDELPAVVPGSPVVIDDLSLVNEFVQLKNIATTPVNISNWIIHDYHKQHVYKIPDFLIRNGQIITIHSLKGNPDSNTLYMGYVDNIWNNEGDTAYLYDQKNNLVSVMRK